MAQRRKAGERTPIGEVWHASRGGLAAVVLFSSFVNILKFAMPLYLLQVLDRVPASRSVETLVILTLAALAAIGAGIALDIVRRRMLLHWSEWIDEQLGPRIVQRSLAGSELHRASDARRGLANLATVRNFVGRGLANWIDLIWAPVFILGVFLIHPILGAVAVLSVIVLLVLALAHDLMTQSSRRAARDAGRDTSEMIRTAERNRESLTGLGMADALSGKWEAASRGRSVERETAEARGLTFRVAMQGFSRIMRIGILAVGIWLFLSDILTLGAIFAARVMAGFGYTLIERAVRNWRGMREAREAYAGLAGQLAPTRELSPSVLSGLKKSTFVFDTVGYRYPYQPNRVFRRVSFELEPGEMMLVTGGAGTGKTTISRLATGLLAPRSGLVRFGEYPVSRLPAKLRAELIGYLPQHIELFSGTIRDNISRLEDAPFDQVVDLAKLVGVHDVIARLPAGYDTPVGPDVECPLSGSARKRIALARALFGRPRLLVLDEPWANLDRPTQRKVGATLRALKDEGTSILVTQAVNSNRLARLADHFMTLDENGAEITSPERPAAKQAPSSLLRRVK